MEFRDDPPDSVIEEIAAILATAYLRLRKEQNFSGSALPAAIQATGEQLDSTPGESRQGGKT
jgi:hypothetical protein